MNLVSRVPVVDIFAGPGGLGEGFSALSGSTMRFELALSVEKDVHAHRTLLLRAFYRKFDRDLVPEEYYRYVRGELGSLEELFELYPEEARLANVEAQHAELGASTGGDARIGRLIANAIRGATDWVLVGGPPCQAYSIMGRSRRINSDPEGFRSDVRHRLYEHYLRILARHGPAVFVMENVKGLLTSRLESRKLLSHLIPDLEHPCRAVARDLWEDGSRPPLDGYRIYSLSHPIDAQGFLDISPGPVPDDLIVKSELHGIPQRRHRVFIVGIRADRPGLRPGVLPRSEDVSVGDVIDDLPEIRSVLSRETDSPRNWSTAIRDQLRRSALDDETSSMLELCVGRLGHDLPVGARFMPGRTVPRAYPDWYLDERLGGTLNHESRPHRRDDLLRYLYLSCIALRDGNSVLLRDFPGALLPDHASASRAVAGRHGYFNDRFRVQVRHLPAMTITSHISKDGHYYIHPDPAQCRSLTVREAARLQTFPDNYFFEGSRTHQYIQVGNAVPPLLARQIADLIAELLSDGVVSRPVDPAMASQARREVAGA